MPSAIDATKPTAGTAYTAHVRTNFAAAKAEIDALEVAINTLEASAAQSDADITAAYQAADAALANTHGDDIGALYTALTDAIDPLDRLNNLRLFGDGSDGDLTISAGAVTPTRDMYYRDLTITGTGHLNLEYNYRIHVSATLNLTNAPTAAIQTTNSEGADGSGTGLNFFPGVGSTPGSIGGSGNGGNGAAGATGAASQGANPTALPAANGGPGGTGGAGGNGSGGAGGAARTGGSITNNLPIRRPTTTLTRGATLLQGGNGGAGGGGGGGDGSAGAAAGAGGSGGGVIAIFARQINRGPSTPAATITAPGKPGGRGANASAGNRGGGGGAGGGGGGWLYIVTANLIGSPAPNALDASGGNGGAGGNGTGTGTGGTGGSGGNGGRITLTNLTANTITTLDDTPNAGTAGGTPSGTNGGTNGIGRQTRLAL